jgi:radical SAM superfamily enzyme YgiQ (UPF0313 family)
MLLIHPPIAKPCEPPAGIAKLSGVLHSHGILHKVLDVNIEGLLSVMQKPRPASDTWTRRAIKNLTSNIAALRDIRTYQSFDRYSRAVRDVNHVLAVSSRDSGALLGLADYQHQHLSPVRSTDLIRAAENPEQNPFYIYYKQRLTEVIEETFSTRRRRERPLVKHSRAGSGREEQPENGEYDEKTRVPVIGISLNYLSQALCTFSMIGYIKKQFPGLKIVLGGGLVSSWMKRSGWKNPFDGLVDHMIAGPGERALLDLIGISDSKQIHSTPNYDSMPVHDYLAPGFMLPYSGSSGCYWHKCSFCPETAEANPYVPISAQQAIRDLAALIGKIKPVLVHLLDNAINPIHMRALVDNPLDVPWYGFVRIDKELLNMDYCMQLKQSGCVMLKLGLESGDQEVLDRMKKGIELSTASQVLHNLQKAGISTYVYLLFGTPYEAQKEARRTLDFVVKHRDAISFLNLAIFNMPLCGHDAGEFETAQFYDGDLSLYTGFKHLRGWDRKRVRQFLDIEFKRHPVISSILRKDPPFFTSNHAAFFVR